MIFEVVNFSADKITKNKCNTSAIKVTFLSCHLKNNEKPSGCLQPLGMWSNKQSAKGYEMVTSPQRSLAMYFLIKLGQ